MQCRRIVNNLVFYGPTSHAEAVVSIPALRSHGWFHNICQTLALT